MGDSDLIVKQIRGEYFVYNPRLTQYRETNLDLIKELLECDFVVIPRKQNIQAHSLATFASTCNFPFHPNHQYTTEVRHMPTIPDNIKYWQIFTQDTQIYHFMNAEGEFQNCKIDTYCIVDDKIDNQIDVNNLDFTEPTKFTQV